MRVRTRRTLFSAAVGVLLGSVITLLVLANLGARERAGRSPSVPVPLGFPEDTAAPASPLAATPVPAAGTPAVSAAALEALGVALELPSGYRLASALNAFTTSRPGSPPRVVITKATVAQEEEYVRLLTELYDKQAATEAPEFIPGQTLTIARVTDASEEQFAGQLAKETATVMTAHSLSGTRYRRVEGLSTYDVTFLRLPSGIAVSVTMSYAVGEPSFDEAAYAAVLEALRPR